MNLYDYVEVPEEREGACRGCDFLGTDALCLHPSTPWQSVNCDENKIIFKLKEKTMKKSDLRTRMRVVYKNGETRTVMLNTENGDVLCNLSFLILDSLSRYREDLTSIYYHSSDIISVYSHSGKLLWEREPINKETIIDCEELGNVSMSTIKEALKAKFNK